MSLVETNGLRAHRQKREIKVLKGVIEQLTLTLADMYLNVTILPPSPKKLQFMCLLSHLNFVSIIHLFVSAAVFRAHLCQQDLELFLLSGLQIFRHTFGHRRRCLENEVLLCETSAPSSTGYT